MLETPTILVIDDALADFLRDKNVWLEAEVHKRTQQVAAIQDVTIMALASLAGTRDSDIGNHIAQRFSDNDDDIAAKAAQLARFRNTVVPAGEAS